jgi:hypothetical protein
VNTHHINSALPAASSTAYWSFTSNSPVCRFHVANKEATHKSRNADNKYLPVWEQTSDHVFLKKFSVLLSVLADDGRNASVYEAVAPRASKSFLQALLA